MPGVSGMDSGTKLGMKEPTVVPATDQKGRPVPQVGSWLQGEERARCTSGPYFAHRPVGFAGAAKKALPVSLWRRSWGCASLML